VRARFSGFTFDGEARELRRGDEARPLSPRALQLLTLLLAARPRPLAQARLRDALWPQTHVGYSSLAQLVAELRKALGDAPGEARFVRTVPRFGYAFVAPVDELEGPPADWFVGSFVTDQSEYLVPEGESLVGRDARCGVRLPSSRVSRVHARLRTEAGGLWVEDAGSKNGTWVNGQRREGCVLLGDGDEVAFGSFRAVFRYLGGEGSTRTGRPAPARP